MTQPSRTRIARPLLVSATVAAVLFAAGCSGEDPVRFKDADHTATPGAGRGFADATLVPERPLDGPQLTAAAEVVRKRASAAGLSVKSVTVRDGTLVLRVSLSTSGADTRQRIGALGSGGQLTVRPVNTVTPFAPATNGPGGTAAPSGGPECADSATPRPDQPTDSIVGCDAKVQEKYALGPAVLTGADVASAEAKAQEQPLVGGWLVLLKWTDKGQGVFTRFTADAAEGRLPTNRIAIVYEGRVLVAPSVMSVIPGDVQISGTFREDEARQLAGKIGAGTLPAGFKLGTYVEGQ
ncbi:SecDF P1 head subdomain-containing protein [Embleya sp. AB8]|uniref:SecDF P1 head subdomain-containing protein n=1 Tax=Embleya sp. AB8 TaxID=3156304 RepID=UPI003C77C78B